MSTDIHIKATGDGVVVFPLIAGARQPSYHLTDGQVPAGWAREVAAKRTRDALTKFGLWEETGGGCGQKRIFSLGIDIHKNTKNTHKTASL